MLRCGNNNKSTTSDGNSDVREKVQTETKYRWKALKDLFIKCPPCGRMVGWQEKGGGGGRVVLQQGGGGEKTYYAWRKIYFEADLTCSQAN